MGSLTSFAKHIPVIKEGIGLVTGAAQQEAAVREQQKAQKQALKQLQDAQRLQERQAAQSAALQREQLANAAADAESARIKALRRAVSRQKAQFGGVSGTGSADGSAQAVLLGLFEETDEDRAQRERLDDIRNRSLDLGLAQGRAINVLQRTQLRERQNIGRLSSNIGRIGSLSNAALNAADFTARLSESEG